jgi:hypothetical protein
MSSLESRSPQRAVKASLLFLTISAMRWDHIDYSWFEKAITNQPLLAFAIIIAVMIFLNQ